MVNGIPQVKAMFRRKAAQVIAEASAAAKNAGEQVVQAQKFLAPVDERKLIESIRAEDASEVTTRRGKRGFIGVIVKAGNAATTVTTNSGGRFDNARLQEFGTKKRAANPFFYPAWRVRRSRVRSAMSRAIRKAWLKP